MIDGLDNPGSISFDHVSFTYKTDAPCVLDDICLDIEAGQFVAVLGANGSGKSTLAKHINALLTPTSGCVAVGGLDTRDEHSVFAIRESAGMVFQNPDNQAVASVVRDDVAFGPENLGLAPTRFARTSRRRLRPLPCKITRLTKRGVSLAAKSSVSPSRAFRRCGRESSYSTSRAPWLDARGRRGITRVAHELNADGMTVVLITHFMEDALGADRVVVLDRGRIALEGTPDEVFTDAAALRALRLELPFSIQLAEDLHARGVEVGMGLSEEKLEEELCQLLSNR